MATPERTLDDLIRKITSLPPDKRTEVEEFVDAQLGKLGDDRDLARTVMAESEPAFAKVWNTSDDDEYDSL
jgi:hypothetical protein